ncbi:MAG: type II toxin-antitoxin system Phd/YefM family antitoxin [Enterobacterales bacterium]|nr:type II toxin-antitoxin system Phd/YefM family antitoxin [Enterobacterales bacterium]
MLKINFTEFRKNASLIFSSVEQGETVHVLRHGKKIAEITPIDKASQSLPSWKKKRVRLTLQGEELSKTIIDEREYSE